jgi:hypothetical protein
VVVDVVVVVTGTQGRESTGAVVVVVVGGRVLVVVSGSLVVVVVVVVSGSVVVVEPGSVLVGGVPANAASPNSVNGAPATIVTNTTRKADEKRRGVDIRTVAAGLESRAHRTTNYRSTTA